MNRIIGLGIKGRPPDINVSFTFQVIKYLIEIKYVRENYELPKPTSGKKEKVKKIIIMEETVAELNSLKGTWSNWFNRKILTNP